MLTIWGRKNSINVQKVLWCADEIRLPYERIDAGMAFGVNDTEDYLAMNPTGRIPTIRDGDFILWESAAIVRYFATKYGDHRILPATVEECAIADQWSEWNNWYIHPELTTAFWGLVRTPEKFEKHVVQAAVDTLIERWMMLEKQVARGGYVVGGKFSYGDIVPGCGWYRFQEIVKDRPATPALDDWYARLTERPAFSKNVMLPLS